ncbi:ComEA family DNA-binding protein [Paenibacillus kribbensis]|uniref:ComEA family DNA-binding protein n=1 Tax=Paenibacillus kribbensis TaxID=172713 RepID=UPI002DBA7DF6|nr:ComEA family DNA-binding protein [Paenibacillus kribbensis]MEC0234765.1 ComEA family DNA-binding protein [Paenibacillus kribbensis]
MKRVWTGTAITLALIGSGLILFAGGQRPEPQEEWTLLNRKVEQVLAVESKPSESQSNGDHAQGKHAVKVASDKKERSTDDEAVGNVKQNAMQGSADVPVAVSENPATGNANPATTSVSGKKRVNINTATAAELMELPGVGAKKAEAILDYRNQHGPFQRVNDLDHVKGIGAKMLAKMKPYVSL